MQIEFSFGVSENSDAVGKSEYIGGKSEYIGGKSEYIGANCWMTISIHLLESKTNVRQGSFNHVVWHHYALELCQCVLP